MDEPAFPQYINVPQSSKQIKARKKKPTKKLKDHNKNKYFPSRQGTLIKAPSHFRQCWCDKNFTEEP